MCTDSGLSSLHYGDILQVIAVTLFCKYKITQKILYKLNLFRFYVN